GGKSEGILVQRGVTFFESEFSLYAGGKLTRIDLPRKAEYQAYIDGRMVFTLQEAWNGFGAGALVAYDPKALEAGPKLIFQPGPRQAIQSVSDTKNLLA